MVGDSLVTGACRRFCGSSQDSRMVRCHPGARVQDVSMWLHYILNGEGDQLEVVVYVGTNDIDRKMNEVL